MTDTTICHICGSDDPGHLAGFDAGARDVASNNAGGRGTTEAMAHYREAQAAQGRGQNHPDADDEGRWMLGYYHGRSAAGGTQG